MLRGCAMRWNIVDALIFFQPPARPWWKLWSKEPAIVGDLRNVA